MRDSGLREHASGPARAENVSGTPGPNARLDDLSLREPNLAHIVVLATQIGQVGQVGQVGVPADDYSPSLALRFCMLAQSLMKQSQPFDTRARGTLLPSRWTCRCRRLAMRPSDKEQSLHR